MSSERQAPDRVQTEAHRAAAEPAEAQIVAEGVARERGERGPPVGQAFAEVVQRQQVVEREGGVAEGGREDGAHDRAGRDLAQAREQIPGVVLGQLPVDHPDRDREQHQAQEVGQPAAEALAKGLLDRLGDGRRRRGGGRRGGGRRGGRRRGGGVGGRRRGGRRCGGRRRGGRRHGGRCRVRRPAGTPIQRPAAHRLALAASPGAGHDLLGERDIIAIEMVATPGLDPLGLLELGCGAGAIGLVLAVKALQEPRIEPGYLG